MRECLRFRPVELAALPTASGVTTCSPLPPVVLQKADEAERLEPLAISRAASITPSKGNVRRRDRDRRPGGPGTSGWPGSQFQGCSSTRADLRDRHQAFDAVDLQIGLAVAGHRHELSRFDVPCMAWRWKNCSPPMPSGARMIEQGRP